MIEILITNLSWVKDLTTIIFSVIAAGIAILTYIRAKETILQPVRTEVIKRQSELLVKLLELLGTEGVEAHLDYHDLVRANVFLWMKQYGFILKGYNEVLSKSFEDAAGSWIYCGNCDIIQDVEIISPFKEVESEARHFDESQSGRLLYEQGKSGVINIDKIFMTQKIISYAKQLEEFKNNPFSPLEIQKSLDKLISDIFFNIKECLKEILSENFLELFKRYSAKQDGITLNPTGVYNEFNHARVHHKFVVQKLRNEIRDYLRIDKMP